MVLQSMPNYIYLDALLYKILSRKWLHMDIITKLQLEHHKLHMFLQRIIQNINTGHVIYPLWEEFLEELDEHFQAEQICAKNLVDICHTELDLREAPEMYSDTLATLANFRKYRSCTGDDVLLQQLHEFQKKLLAHSYSIEDAVSKLVIDVNLSKELCVRFDADKDTVLAQTISYA